MPEAQPHVQIDFYNNDSSWHRWRGHAQLVWTIRFLQVDLVADSMSIAWNNIEDTLRSWIKIATNLTDGHIIWGEQTGARPSDSASAPFVTARLGDIRPVAIIDELTALTNSATPGQEIELRVTGTREFRVLIQAFHPSVVSSTGSPSNTARALLSKIQTALLLPSIRASFDAVNISPWDMGTVQNLTELIGTKFEGRAALDVGFYVLESVSERTTYIETVQTASYMGPPELGTKDAIDI